MLIVIRDLGSSLMFFGGFLALLYVATGRISLGGEWGRRCSSAARSSWPTTSATSTSAWTSGSTRSSRGWSTTRATRSRSPLFAQADGGLFGQGFGEALIEFGGAPILPAAHTDLIYAVLVNEAGLFGAAGVIGAYLLFAFRGFKTAMIANDGFSKLLAVGLSAVFALQVFVIVGGVTRVIPLTGVTLPFVSYGGSSIVANMVLLALLLIVSDHARAERMRRGGLV